MILFKVYFYDKEWDYTAIVSYSPDKGERVVVTRSDTEEYLGNKKPQTIDWESSFFTFCNTFLKWKVERFREEPYIKYSIDKRFEPLTEEENNTISKYLKSGGEFTHLAISEEYYKKIRRRVEDCLRKGNNKQIADIATLLNIKLN